MASNGARAARPRRGVDRAQVFILSSLAEAAAQFSKQCGVDVVIDGGRREDSWL